MKLGDRVQCVRGYSFENGRRNQTGKIVGVIMAWDDNSGREEINIKDFKIISKSAKRVTT